MAERTLLQRFEQAGPSTWLLAACAGWALLLWAGALLGMGGHVAEAKAASTDSALPQAAPATPDRVGPLTQYAEAAARPVFTQDRRPRSFMATGPEGDTDAQSQSLDFILTGVLISPQVRLAVLQPSGGGESQRVREGKSPEGAAGWRLLEVQPRRAVFEGPGGQSTLDLRSFGDAAAPATVATAVPPPPPPPQSGPARGTQALPAVVQPQDQEARIEAIRKRIEARRAQLRAARANSSPAAPPTKP